jgi:predicted branched-subunit amino acid permease
VPHIGSAPLLRRAFASYFVVDQVFAVSIKAFDFDGGFDVGQKIAFIVGAGSAIFPFWIGGTLAGALVGNAIPPEFSLDFAIPICFISITAPMMRSLPHLVAAIVSITAALALAWLPYYLWLMAAAMLAMIAGAQTESWLGRRRA